ncbi:hypothetical protein HAX54_004328, partial [Datura stramonium]|nr:hypothetical protein [Datura stramonium]
GSCPSDQLKSIPATSLYDLLYNLANLDTKCVYKILIRILWIPIGINQRDRHTRTA